MKPGKKYHILRMEMEVVAVYYVPCLDEVALLATAGNLIGTEIYAAVSLNFAGKIIGK